jgi:hypothetical protein
VLSKVVTIETDKNRDTDRQAKTYRQGKPIHGLQLLLGCFEPALGAECVGVGAVDVFVVGDDRGGDADAGPGLDELRACQHAGRQNENCRNVASRVAAR